MLLEFSGPHTGRIDGIDFNPDGTLLATSSSSGLTKVWDVNASITSGTSVEHVTLSEQIGLDSQDIQFSPDGRYVAANFSDDTVRIFVLNSDELLALAHSRVTRSLTDDECRQYLHLEECP
jgi:WD40 repeat protein